MRACGRIMRATAGSSNPVTLKKLSALPVPSVTIVCNVKVRGMWYLTHSPTEPLSNAPAGFVVGLTPAMCGWAIRSAPRIGEATARLAPPKTPQAFITFSPGLACQRVSRGNQDKTVHPQKGCEIAFPNVSCSCQSRFDVTVRLDRKFLPPYCRH